MPPTVSALPGTSRTQRIHLGSDPSLENPRSNPERRLESPPPSWPPASVHTMRHFVLNSSHVASIPSVSHNHSIRRVLQRLPFSMSGNGGSERLPHLPTVTHSKSVSVLGFKLPLSDFPGQERYYKGILCSIPLSPCPGGGAGSPDRRHTGSAAPHVSHDAFSDRNRPRGQRASHLLTERIFMPLQIPHTPSA